MNKLSLWLTGPTKRSGLHMHLKRAFGMMGSTGSRCAGAKWASKYSRHPLLHHSLHILVLHCVCVKISRSRNCLSLGLYPVQSMPRPESLILPALPGGPTILTPPREREMSYYCRTTIRLDKRAPRLYHMETQAQPG